MTIEKIINVKAQTTGAQSVKSIKQELREAKEEAIRLAREFGEFSPQATKAAAKVAQLKDEMDDFGKRVDALNPDKFGAIAKVGEGVAKGFAGAQGAMALFGVESKDVEKQLLKVQGAMAMAQGVEALGDLKQGFGQLASTVMPRVRAAFASTAAAARTIGAAIGVAAIIAGIVLLIKNFDFLKKKIYELIPGLKGMFEWVGKTVTSFTDWIGVTSEQGRQLDALTAATNRQNEALNNQIAILEAQGGKEKEIYDAKVKLVENEMNVLRKKFDNNKKLSEEEWVQFRKLQADRKVLDIQEQNRLKALADKAEADAAAAHEKNKQRAAEVAAQRKAAYDRAVQDQREFNEKIKAIEDEFDAADKNNKKRKEAEEQKDREKAGKNLEGYLAARDAIRAKYAQAEENRKKAEAEMEKKLFDDSMTILGAVSSLLGEQTKAGKVFALAQIAADTARAITGALANSQSATPDNVATGGLAGIAKFAAIAATVLTNAARAKQILQSGGTSQPSISSTAPSQATFQQPQTFTQQFSANTFRQDGRVYVLESDISNTQRRVNVNKRVSVV